MGAALRLGAAAVAQVTHGDGRAPVWSAADLAGQDLDGPAAGGRFEHGFQPPGAHARTGKPHRIGKEAGQRHADQPLALQARQCDEALVHGLDPIAGADQEPLHGGIGQGFHPQRRLPFDTARGTVDEDQPEQRQAEAGEIAYQFESGHRLPFGSRVEIGRRREDLQRPRPAEIRQTQVGRPAMDHRCRVRIRPFRRRGRTEPNPVGFVGQDTARLQKGSQDRRAQDGGDAATHPTVLAIDRNREDEALAIGIVAAGPVDGVVAGDDFGTRQHGVVLNRSRSGRHFLGQDCELIAHLAILVDLDFLGIAAPAGDLAVEHQDRLFRLAGDGIRPVRIETGRKDVDLRDGDRAGQIGVDLLDRLARIATQIGSVPVKAGDARQQADRAQVAIDIAQRIFERLALERGFRVDAGAMARQCRRPVLTRIHVHEAGHQGAAGEDNRIAGRQTSHADSPLASLCARDDGFWLMNTQETGCVLRDADRLRDVGFAVAATVRRAYDGQTGRVRSPRPAGQRHSGPQLA